MALKSSKSEIERREFEIFLRFRSFLIMSSKLRLGLPRLPLKILSVSALIANNIDK